MSDVASLHISYDRRADVLYIADGNEAARGVQDKHGIIWRYNKNDAAVGATIMDFREEWEKIPDVLSSLISNRIGLPARYARELVDKGLQLARNG